MTNVLYELVKKSKEDSQALQLIIDIFEPKIKKSLRLTTYNERDDLAQELKCKLVDSILEYDIEATPGFWELQEQMSQKSS